MDGATYRMFGNEDTLGQLGERLTARLTDIAQKDILLITREDLSPGYRQSGIDHDLARRNLRDLFQKAGLGNATDQEIAATVDNVFSTYAYATTADADGNGTPDVGIIVSPDMDTSAENIISVLTDLPEDAITDLPGSDRDYVDAVLYHEARHLNQDTTDYGEAALPFEVDADRHMVEEIHRAHDEGDGMDPRVAKVMLDARAAGTLTQDLMDMVRNPFNVNKMFGSHTTHLDISRAEAMGLPHDMGADPQAILTTNTIIGELVGNYFRFEGIKEWQEGTVPLEDRIFPTQQAILNSYLEPKEYAQGIEEYLQRDPVMAYEVLKVIREKNYVPDGSPEAEYADNVMGFFEKHLDLEGQATQYSQSARELFSHAPVFDPEKPVPGIQSTEGPDLQDKAPIRSSGGTMTYSPG